MKCDCTTPGSIGEREVIKSSVWDTCYRVVELVVVLVHSDPVCSGEGEVSAGSEQGGSKYQMQLFR